MRDASTRAAAYAAGFLAIAAPGLARAAVDPPYPLLGSSHARSAIVDFCAGKPDDTPIPVVDPRTLVRPGVNAGRAVVFNVFWEDCHGAHPSKRSRTCGEFRERAARGFEFLAHGYAPTGGLAITPEQYEGVWRLWNLPAKPADMEAEIRERWGLAKAPYRNPYPRPGQDPPNPPDGGSGQLPLGLVQTRDASGSYSGKISTSCFVCHQGQVGDPNVDGGPGGVPGLGAHNGEYLVEMNESIGAQFNGLPVSPPASLPLSSNRGTVNAEGLSEILFVLRDVHSMDGFPNVGRIDPFHANAGDTDTPPWWNLSHRPRKFWEAGMSSDGGRLAIALWYAAETSMNGAAIRGAIDAHEMDVLEWFDTLEAPVYPFEVDTALAAKGATIFHARDLWAGDNPVPRPAGGNGSCASCHGVYSERFAHDPAFLEDPRLAGMSAYVSPLDEIRTDPKRSDGMPMSLRKSMSVSWLAYPEGKPGYVRPEDKDPLSEWLDDFQFTAERSGVENPAFTNPYGACGWERERIGYQAPQLHGIWASAPYLHNGSVPDVWGVLDPSSRPAVWRRDDSKAPTVNHGFDTSLAAIDRVRLGWKHRSLDCEGTTGVPYLSCDPADDTLDPIARILLVDLMGTSTAGYVSTPTTNETVEQRKIFNTHMYGKSNAGHDFTAVLGDEERRALIEYLKTL
jgi:mono/diheme cytochrome c family protein